MSYLIPLLMQWRDAGCEPIGYFISDHLSYTQVLGSCG